MYRYNKKVYINLIIVAVIFGVLFFTDGVLIATGGTILVLAIVAALFRCYRIDVTDKELVIYQFYAKRIILPWSEIKSIHIAALNSENRIMGPARNMVIKVNLKVDVKINVEPLDNPELYEVIEIKCKENEIEYKKQD
jgi:hypothetical protein